MHLKRLNSPKFWKAGRKTNVWVVRPMPGPHPANRSIPLLVIVRDILNLASRSREAKYIIRQGKILVDNKPRYDYKFPVGLMDVIEIPDIDKVYRVIPTKRGLELVEIPKEDKNLKISKIVRKMKVKGGKLQYTTHDGRNFLDIEAKTGDSLLLEFDNGVAKVKEVLPLKEGMLAIVLKGKHAGSMARVINIKEGGNVILEGGREVFEANKADIIIIGKDKPVVKFYAE